MGVIKINKKKVIKKNNEYIVQILERLNSQAGTNYRASTKSTRQHINARLAEGFTLQDFFTVIDKKVAEWKGDAKMEKYLRPETLFGNKFDGYLNAPAAQKRGASGVAIAPPLDDDLDALEEIFG